jgi:carotenoid cleavage dioxygenase
MSDNPYLSGNFAPVAEETTELALSVTGKIPAELCGRLLRIGPNPVAPDPETHHWFTGNGMVHGVRLREGRAEWYRNRYVHDDELCETFGWPAVPGPEREMLGGGVANTNVIGHAGRTYAIIEAGNLPVELSDELETLRRSDFDGTLPAGFSAHPKRDPDTGELHAAVYSPLWEHVQHVVVGVDGRVRRTVDVPVPGRPMVHDCAITENYFIVLDLPVIFDPELLVQGSSLPYKWHPEYGARVGLLAREGEATDVVWCDVEPCYVFHPMNAYEDGDGRVVLDVVRHPKMFATDMQGPNEGAPTLDRWIVDPRGGSVKEQRLDERGQEFPRHDERLIGKPYRYGYTACFDESLALGGLFRHDLRDGKTDVHSEGGARSFMEPVFVPRSDDAAEDDGWLLAYVYDASTDKSDVVILHAQDFTGEPVATIHLPGRVPYGFHGNWLPDSA